jgi:carbamoyl-phosphate synthase large subunit
MVVIEMNPRVSRSSALASKATGFPIAKVAAKLAVGYTLDELANDITGGATPASFEPTIDYVVTKIPRFAFEKFPGAEPTLTTSMKSVGEAMAIGRTFQESLQKALRSLETGLTGLDEIEIPGSAGRRQERRPRARARHADARPPALCRQAMRSADASRRSRRLQDRPVVPRADEGHRRHRSKVREHGLPPTPPTLRMLKAMGFSDARLAEALPASRRPMDARAREPRRAPGLQAHRHLRGRVRLAHRLHVLDLRAALRRPGDEARPSDRKKVVILGGGPNRIGQGIEFDYCCCHAAFALRDAGYETIMVNCNPETVSTDYDTSDRLYFEPLTAEDVLEILENRAQNGTLHGVIVQFGGQTPLKLAERAGKGRRADPRHLARTPSTSPKTATASSCSTSSA